MLKIGIIGTGRMAGMHLPRILKTGKAEVTSAFDLNRDAVEKFTQDISARPYSDDIENYFNKEKPDAVWILTPPDAHTEAVRQAVEYDVPFFIEKPLALSDDGLEELAPKVEKMFHSVGYMMRYQDIATRAKELVADETIALAVAQYFFQVPMVASNRKKEKSGGQVREQLTHLIDLMRYLVGDVLDVYSRSSKGMFPEIPEFTCDDASASVLTFENGTVGNLACTYALSGPILQQHPPKLQLIMKKKLIEIVPGNYLKCMTDQEETLQEDSDLLYREDQAFIEGLLADDRSRIKSTFSDAMKTLSVSLAANRSMQSTVKEYTNQKR